MQKYEYNVTVEKQGDLWYYVVAQEVDDRVEFLGWGYTDTAQEAADYIGVYIKEQFK